MRIIPRLIKEFGIIVMKYNQFRLVSKGKAYKNRTKKWLLNATAGINNWLVKKELCLAEALFTAITEAKTQKKKKSMKRK